MSVGRLLLVAVVLTLAIIAYRAYTGSSRSAAPAAGGESAIERARAVARSGEARRAQTDAASREGEIAPGGAVTENMTPDQVRVLLGAPDETSRETTEAGVARERWTYRSAGKTVVFENGIVARIE